MTRWPIVVPAVLVWLAGAVGIVATVALSGPAKRAGGNLDGVPTGEDAGPLSDDQFARLVEADPISALQAAVRAYPGRGFTAKFHKQERAGGTLKGAEVIRAAVADDPYSVLMVWEQGGGPAKGTVFVRQANAERQTMRVDMPLVGPTTVDTQAALPKRSARYCIEEFGLKQTTQKTLKAWAAAKEKGELKYDYLGRRAVPEVGGRECFVLRRTCPADHIDPFISGGDPVAVDDKNRRDSFRTVTAYIDCQTRLQVGTEQHRHDGELTASYWFRDVNLSPTFDADAFTDKAFKK